MVRRPKVFLLDEPLSNLDPGLRTQARAELRRLHRSLRATVVYVTHDQEEAMTLGDRIAVMRDGVVDQAGSPEEVYGAPATTFTARFIGEPAMNFLPASYAPVDAASAVIVGVRPHDVTVSEHGRRATVELAEPRGADTILHLRLDDGVEVVAVARATVPVGAVTSVAWAPERVHLFTRDGLRL
jgi:ABC-type sugar transport system ATPase subunit